MGWNTVTVPAGSRLFAGIENERFYFVHSYATQSWDLGASGSFRQPLVTWCEYGGRFVAAVENGPLCATQFHPEKSGEAGLALLRNWVGRCRPASPLASARNAAEPPQFDEGLRREVLRRRREREVGGRGGDGYP